MDDDTSMFRWCRNLNSHTRASLKVLAIHLIERWLEEGNPRFLEMATTPLGLAHHIGVVVISTDVGRRLSVESDWLAIQDLEEFEITETLVEAFGEEIDRVLANDLDLERVHVD